MKDQILLKTTFNYVVNKMEDAKLNWILENELSREEKKKILSKLKNTRKKQVLLNSGVNEKFLCLIKSL